MNWIKFLKDSFKNMSQLNWKWKQVMTILEYYFSSKTFSTDDYLCSSVRMFRIYENHCLQRRSKAILRLQKIVQFKDLIQFEKNQWKEALTLSPAATLEMSTPRLSVSRFCMLMSFSKVLAIWAASMSKLLGSTLNCTCWSSILRKMKCIFHWGPNLYHRSNSLCIFRK